MFHFTILRVNQHVLSLCIIPRRNALHLGTVYQHVNFQVLKILLGPQNTLALRATPEFNTTTKTCWLLVVFLPRFLTCWFPNYIEQQSLLWVAQNLHELEDAPDITTLELGSCPTKRTNESMVQFQLGVWHFQNQQTVKKNTGHFSFICGCLGRLRLCKAHSFQSLQIESSFPS